MAVGISFQRVCGEIVVFVSTNRAVGEDVESRREENSEEECTPTTDCIEELNKSV